MKRPKINLAHGEHIVTAYAQPANGPGWANAPIWYVVRGADGKLRQECLQPSEQTREMTIIYRMCAAAHSELLGWLGAITVNAKEKP